MLGISSIQKTSHLLEDCFKILEGSPVRVDQKLEELFLGVFDTLQSLVDQLQGPFGLTEDVAAGLMSTATTAQPLNRSCSFPATVATTGDEKLYETGRLDRHTRLPVARSCETR